MHKHPEKGFLRLKQILPQSEVTEAEAAANRTALEVALRNGDKAAIRKARAKPRRARQATPGIIPVSSSNWWAGCKNGRYPPPLHLGPRTTVWRSEEIVQLVDRLGKEEVAA